MDFPFVKIRVKSQELQKDYQRVGLLDSVLGLLDSNINYMYQQIVLGLDSTLAIYILPDSVNILSFDNASRNEE
jgi:hypothetical protein